MCAAELRASFTYPRRRRQARGPFTAARRVRACGGEALVQEPAEAAFGEMPAVALRQVEGARAMAVLGCVHGAAAPCKTRGASAASGSAGARARSAHHRPRIELRRSTRKPDEISLFSCPECGGPLAGPTRQAAALAVRRRARLLGRLARGRHAPADRIEPVGCDSSASRCRSTGTTAGAARAPGRRAGNRLLRAALGANTVKVARRL